MDESNRKMLAVAKLALAALFGFWVANFALDVWLFMGFRPATLDTAIGLALKGAPWRQLNPEALSYMLVTLFIVIVFWWLRPFFVGIKKGILFAIMALILYIVTQNLLNATGYFGNSAGMEAGFILHGILSVWAALGGLIFGLLARFITAPFARRIDIDGA